MRQQHQQANPERASRSYDRAAEQPQTWAPKEHGQHAGQHRVDCRRFGEERCDEQQAAKHNSPPRGCLEQREPGDRRQQRQPVDARQRRRMKDVRRSQEETGGERAR